jgi:hypothetical protein
VRDRKWLQLTPLTNSYRCPLSKKLGVDDLSDDQKRQLLEIIVRYIPHTISGDCEPEIPMELFMALGDWWYMNFPDKRNRR